MNNNIIDELYIASSSPRRAELLLQYGFIFKVLIPDSQEVLDPDPLTRTSKNAQLKVQSVLNKVPNNGVALGVDTVVAANKEIFGKPHTAEDNYSMLQKLVEHKKHKVITALVLMSHISSVFRSFHEITTVEMRNISEKELQSYIKTREGIDKAGGYGIQGKGAFLIERIEGCYNNVVGLPMTQLVTQFLSIPEINIESILPWIDITD